MDTRHEGRWSPEDEGIPAVADDTSTAEDTGVRPPMTDSPAALPTDGPALGRTFGTTAAQTSQGESLARKLAREEADRSPAPTDDQEEEVGRMVAPDAGSGFDNEALSIGYDTGEHDGLSAEEAAMHIYPADAEQPLE